METMDMEWNFAWHVGDTFQGKVAKKIKRPI